MTDNTSHTLSITVCAADIDGLGHVNNGRYIAWCEQVAWLHSDTLGLNVGDYQRLDRAMAVYRSEYDYKLPGFEDDVLTATTWLSFAKGSRMTRNFVIQRDADQSILLEALWHLGCIELTSGKPKRFPPEFIEVYVPIVRP